MIAYIFCTSHGKKYHSHWPSSSLNSSNWLVNIWPRLHNVRMAKNDQHVKKIVLRPFGVMEPCDSFYALHYDKLENVKKIKPIYSILFVKFYTQLSPIGVSTD